MIAGRSTPSEPESLPQNSPQNPPQNPPQNRRGDLGRANRKPNVLVTLGWYDPRLLEGIGRGAREFAWHLESRSLVEASLPMGWEGQGMLLNDTNVPRMARFIRDQIRRQPTVLLGANHRQLRLPSVEEDNLGGGRLAAQHFLERGYRHFAWFGISRGRVESERRQGYVEELSSAGRECHLLDWRPPNSAGDTWTNCRRWLSARLRRLPKPLALFALDDLLAADAIEACLDCGFRVPEDVAVMGAGNIELGCECSQIAISSVDLNTNEMAYQAARLLQNLMNGTPPPDSPLIVPLRGIVQRQSTNALALTHPGMARAIGFITEHFAQPIGVEEIAAAAGLSRRSLHYAFQEELRRSPARHLLLTRLQQAQLLLRQSNQKISQIARACGFTQVRNLHRCFDRELGLSPGLYRKDPNQNLPLPAPAPPTK